jgi:hypothetical protein
MGRRKISFEPPVRIDVFEWSSVMKVSLCGPHSFDMSTLDPTGTDGSGAAALAAPPFRRVWYFVHQVGRSGLRD